MTENEFDQDIESQVKTFREHDARVDELTKQVTRLETQLLRKLEEIERLQRQEMRWSQVLQVAGFNVGRHIDPVTFEPAGELTEDLAALAIPRLLQLVKLGEQFEFLIRSTESNEVTRNQFRQLAASIKLLNLQLTEEDAS